VATNNKDFVVKQGIKVATGVTFPDNSVQTTAFTGSAITVGSSFPGSPSSGQMHLDTNTNRVYYYYSSSWYAMANYDDTSTVVNHTHFTGIDENGSVKDIYQYNGNGVSLPALMGTALDGGAPGSTYTITIDGGAAA
jgi:hypothetical protein